MNQKSDFTIFAVCLLSATFVLTVAGGLLLPSHTAAASTSISGIVTVPSTLKPLYPSEDFGPDNLYEKINGQAELYLSAGFVRLKSQWFGEKQDTANTFEVYIYRMADSSSAFSVYSAQRGADVETSDVTPFAYRTQDSLNFLHGPYYVEMIAAAPSAKLLSQMVLLARNFIKDTPVNATPFSRLALFPSENLDRASLRLIAQDAFGFNGLDRVYTAVYTIDTSKVTAFISPRKTPQEARDLARGLYDYFTTFGGKDINTDLQIKDVKMIEIMDTFEIVFALDGYLVGVHEASGKTQAEKIASDLAHSLQEMLGATNGNSK